MATQNIGPLVSAKARRTDQLARATADRLRGQLMRFDGWYDDALVRELAEHLGVSVDTAAKMSATQMDAYLTRLLKDATGRPAQHGPAITQSARAGVTAADAYERLGANYRYARARGQSHTGAMTSTLDRASRMAHLDVSLAGRGQARNTLAANNRTVAGFRRVLRPELAKTGSCGLCIVAADQVYKTFDLMPIHGGCNCGVAPIIGDLDPADRLNQSDLTRLYDAAVGTTSQGLRNVRVVVEEHSEYGPLLTQVQGPHRKLYQVREDSRNARVVDLRAQIADHEKSLSQALAERASGLNRDRDIRTHTSAIERLAQQLTRAT